VAAKAGRAADAAAGAESLPAKRGFRGVFTNLQGRDG
jgi:hypothetical protein